MILGSVPEPQKGRENLAVDRTQAPLSDEILDGRRQGVKEVSQSVLGGRLGNLGRTTNGLPGLTGKGLAAIFAHDEALSNSGSSRNRPYRCHRFRVESPEGPVLETLGLLSFQPRLFYKPAAFYSSPRRSWGGSE